MGDRPITKPESLLESGADTEEKSGSFDDDIDCDECEEINIGESNEKKVCCSIPEASDSTVDNISSSPSSATMSDDNVIKKTIGRNETFISSSKKGKNNKHSRSEMCPIFGIGSN